MSFFQMALEIETISFPVASTLPTDVKPMLILQPYSHRNLTSSWISFVLTTWTVL